MLAKDNPFAAGRFDAIAFRFPDGDDMDRLIDRLNDVSMRGAIVGGEGRGKTTLLDAIEDCLEASDFSVIRHSFRAGQTQIPRAMKTRIRDADSRTILLIDGAEQLALLSWHSLKWKTRPLGGLVVTSHRGGLLPTVIQCETSTALLSELLDELAPARPDHFPSARELLMRHEGNIRHAMFEAYDFFAAMDPDSREELSNSAESRERHFR